MPRLKLIFNRCRAPQWDRTNETLEDYRWDMRIRLAIAILFTLAQTGLADDAPPTVDQFLKKNCYDCHEGASAEAGFDLTKLSAQYEGTDVQKWVRMFDRVESGEMPPSDYGQLEKNHREDFLNGTSAWLITNQRREHQTLGRVRGKRLTNLQLERTLHDLLGIDIPLATRMPEESRVGGFTTVADGQPMSHFQLEQHLDVVDAALDEAFRRALSTRPDEWSRTFNARQIARRNSRRRCREPEMLDGLAVTWSARLVFYGRLPVTTARESGWYRMTVRAKALKPPESGSVWCTIRTGQCFSGAPLMSWAGAFEATEEFKEVTVVTWLPKNHMFEIRPGDINLKRANFRGGQVGAGEGGPQNVPGVAIESIQLSRIHPGPGDDGIRKMVLGDLPLVKDNELKRMVPKSKQPKKDASVLIEQFAEQAFRRPVDPRTIAPYVSLVNQAIDRGDEFAEALQNGYRAVLCSPRFLYFQERPGKLDDFAVASRLSYFLWNRMPDQRLWQLAEAGKLQDRKVISQQVERMLDDPRSQSFVRDLANEWLDLSLIDFTEPDPRLYRGFDPIVQNSMLQETQTYLQTMLDEDLSVGCLIDSDFTFLNSRLARYYGIGGVNGDDLRRVSLKPTDHRGGLLTQGAILKVTANGTTTSPVIRGVWISERLLGQEIPPPPANVPAIEPDIRGAKTIREQLSKHKNDSSCAACHVKIDPPGFALENYDPSGRWRDRYQKFQGRKRIPGIVVDASAELPNGKSFENIDDFQRLILEDRKSVAANVVEKLLTYGTGAPISFKDRQTVEHCVQQAKDSDYGFRSLVHSVIKSDVFLSK
jgi:hypothetical protein